MACHGARRLGQMSTNLNRIIGIELLTAAQGVELRAPLKTSPPLSGVIAALRENVPSLGDDRFMANDIEASSDLVATGVVCGLIKLELNTQAA